MRRAALCFARHAAAEADQPLGHHRVVKCSVERGGELGDDFGRRALRYIHGTPDARVEAGNTGLLG